MILPYILAAVREAVAVTKLHPILVNFTAALVPTSVACDAIARWRRHDQLRATAWWTLLLAAWITPLTAATGWLFWMDDDDGVLGMTIHRWLGTAIAMALVGLCLWRRRIRRSEQWAGIAYLAVAIAFVAAVAVQGTLGGRQVFSGM
ncbi:MAG: hypothetical protein H6674_09220 [Dehalococcoidia bacterium]|nr:hypothetical protein [Myxococcales bacterium]MCB9492228.1 hypothetical protein [Dehalococcoidia bacterium]